MRARKRNAWKGRGLDKRQARRARRRAGMWQNTITRWEAGWIDEAWEITSANSHLLQELFAACVVSREPGVPPPRPRLAGPDPLPLYELVVLDEDLGTLVAARDSNTGDLIAVGFDGGRDTPEDPDS